MAGVFSRLQTERPDMHAVLIGRGAAGFREALTAVHPKAQARVHAADGVAPEVAATWIKSCDLAIQAFPDGVTTRRGSAMAVLARTPEVVTGATPLPTPRPATAAAARLPEVRAAAPSRAGAASTAPTAISDCRARPLRAATKGPQS